MYKGNTTDKASNDRPSARYNDSKYVADILSSMANGEPAAPGYTLPAYASSVATGTTPTLTPTTLANIEQTFIELQSVPVSSAGQDGLNQSGFVPPIVDPISGSDQTPGGTPDRYDYSDSDQDSWMGPPSKTSLSDNGKVVTSNPSYCASRGRKRRSREDDLDDPSISPEEAERRRVRRERNKVAAAKCRQRRVDHTNRLINETDKLEDEKSSLETEIQTLQQQKDQLEFILQAHKPLCKAEGIVDKTRVKTEFRDKDCTSNGTTLPSIKREMPDFMDDYGSHCALKMDRQRPSHNTCSRPSSLSLQPKSVSQSLPSVSLSSATGISITTPSSGFYTFDMDAHSGLTPLGAPSCGSQIQRSSVDSSPDGVNSPTLISL